ncbi:MAG TPA: DUF418 domain-containing protein, partial [Povalibacter sp.]|nr:DUF418 domain-containing protein [Povalibacter sp.]
DTPANRDIFRRLLVWAGMAALVTTVITTLYPTSFALASVADVLRGFASNLQQASLSAFYVAAVTLMFWKQPARGLLPQLAPMGKMGLTTYLTQTAFGLIVFYGFGFGLMGRLGLAACVALGILFFIAQIFLARWWMRYFNLGPFEWLWRSLTYLRLQPNLRSRLSTA